jgi:threonine dehydratase
MELEAPTLDEIRAARQRIAAEVVRTPLVRLNADVDGAEVWLKLENLQPIGSVKLRGATNAMALASAAELARGVYTASAGNMAQGVAWGARRRGIACGVVVPDTAPETKLAAITRLGAEIEKVPLAAWWDVLVTRRFARWADRLFVHPVSDRAVIAGNGTIGLEIVEDLPDVDAVIVPYGGGGLVTGIGTAVKALRPNARVFAAEPATAAPLAASLAAGEPRAVDYVPSFVDGCGGKGLLAEMWPIVRRIVDGSFAMPIAAIADAVRLLAERNRIVAEGAGAVATAAVLAGNARGKIVCVVSGGNLDSGKLARILAGEVP